MYDREDLLFLENEEAGNVKITVRIPGKVQMKGKGTVQNEFADCR